jgi:hypothetical protein
MMKYAAWTIENTGDKYVATYQDLTVYLRDGKLLWGWWPSEPTLAGSATVVTGICLFDRRWQLEFKNPKPGQRGAVRSIALPREREEAQEFLKRGREIERVLFPQFPTPYAQKLIDFQKWGLWKLRDLGVVVERVLYHIPRREYLCYCSILPSPWKEKMETVVKEQAQKIGELVSKELSEWPLEIHWGGENPPQSFVDLYVRALREGFVVGLEELVELRLPLEASRQTRKTIPTLVGVLSFPHPYFRPPEEEVIALEL